MLNKTETYTLLGNNVEYNNHRRQTDIQLEICLIYIDRLLAVLKKYKSTKTGRVNWNSALTVYIV